VITRVGSRWRVGARHSSLKKHFATLGGAVAWCQQQYDAQPTHEEPARLGKAKIDLGRVGLTLGRLSCRMLVPFRTRLPGILQWMP
jgi:hypothetical protein